jgi:hypothetical protein
VSSLLAVPWEIVFSMNTQWTQIVCACELNLPIHPVTFSLNTRGFHVADDTYVWLSDTFCASHQQARKGQADKMVHSVPTEAESQGMHLSLGFQSTCSVSFSLLEPFRVLDGSKGKDRTTYFT